MATKESKRVAFKFDAHSLATLEEMKEDGHYSSLLKLCVTHCKSTGHYRYKRKKDTTKSLCVTRRLEMNASLLFLHCSHFLEGVSN